MRLKMKWMLKFLVVLFLLPSFSFAQSMAAGQWSAQASFKLNGIPMPPSHSEECIAADKAKDAKATIEKSLERDSCRLTDWSIKKGKLNAKVSCKNDSYEANGELSGLFDRKSYDLAGDIQGTHKMFGKAKASVEFSGRWTGPCQGKN